MNKQIYYHFLPSYYATDDLERRRIRISTLDTLNDPFEMMPYRRYEFKERQPYNKVFRVISKKWGLLCFSQSWHEQLLWAHYADKHMGIALGFDILKDEILKVRYDSDPIRTKHKLTNDPRDNEEKFLSLAKVKYQEWKYEKEYRILVKLKDCEPEKDKKTGKLNYFLKFGDRLKIKEIVLGCRFNHEKENENVSRLAKQLGAEVIPARPGWEDYKIHQCGTKTKQYQKIQTI